MSYEYSYVMGESIAGIITGLLSGIPMGLLGIVGYVLSALALYTLAKRRGINHPWLSWVPVANCWIVGSLSDQYRYVVRGENRSKRKSLLILSMINILIVIGVIVLLVAMIFGIAENAMHGSYMGGYVNDDVLEEVLGPLFGILGLSLPMLGISIAIAVIYYMALYDIYTSMDPGNNVLFLVLSIIFQVTEPFFLFFNRNKDLGMPPRRQEYEMPPREEYTWQPPQAAEEPWENPEEP